VIDSLLTFVFEIVFFLLFFLEKAFISSIICTFAAKFALKLYANTEKVWTKFSDISVLQRFVLGFLNLGNSQNQSETMQSGCYG